MMAFFCSSVQLMLLREESLSSPHRRDSLPPVDMKGLKTGKALKPREVLNLPADEGKIRKGRKIDGADHEAGGIVSPEKESRKFGKAIEGGEGKIMGIMKFQLGKVHSA